MTTSNTISIDWATDFIWVADNTPLKVVSPASDNEDLRATKPSGEILKLSKDQLDRGYYAVENSTVLKPRYRPFKAYPIAATGSVILPTGETMDVAEGAILTEDDATFRFVPYAQYDREFTVVGLRGQDRPASPFSN